MYYQYIFNYKPIKNSNNCYLSNIQKTNQLQCITMYKEQDENYHMLKKGQHKGDRQLAPYLKSINIKSQQNKKRQEIKNELLQRVNMKNIPLLNIEKQMRHLQDWSKKKQNHKFQQFKQNGIDEENIDEQTKSFINKLEEGSIAQIQFNQLKNMYQEGERLQTNLKKCQIKQQLDSLNKDFIQSDKLQNPGQLLTAVGKVWVKLQLGKHQKLGVEERTMRFQVIKNDDLIKNNVLIEKIGTEHQISLKKDFIDDDQTIINCKSLIEKISEYDSKQWDIISYKFSRYLCEQSMRIKRKLGFYYPKPSLKYIKFNLKTKSFVMDPRSLFYWAFGLIEEPVNSLQKTALNETPTGQLDPTIYINPHQDLQLKLRLERKIQKLCKEDYQISTIFHKINKTKNYIKYSQRETISKTQKRLLLNYIENAKQAQISQDSLENLMESQQNQENKQYLNLIDQFKYKFQECVGVYNYLMLAYHFQNGFPFNIEQWLKKSNKIQKFEINSKTYTQIKSFFIKLCFTNYQILWEILLLTYPRSNQARKQITQRQLYKQKPLTLQYIKIKILNIKENQQSLRRKYYQEVIQYRNRCKYNLQLIKNVSFPDSALLLASHNATRYLIIGFLCILFDIEKKMFDFQNIRDKNTQKNNYEFEQYLEQYLPLQIKQVVDKINSFLKKSIEKITYYQENSYQMVENHKIVTVKARSYVQFLKELYQLKQKKSPQFIKSRFQVIKTMEIFLIDHLFHKRIFKFKELQLSYQFKEKVEEKKQMEIAKFVIEAILLNYTILQIFTLSESYKIKQKAKSNMQQITFKSTRYFNELPHKDFQQFKFAVDKNNKQQARNFGHVSLLKYSHQQLKQYIITLVKNSQQTYQNSGMVYDLKHVKKGKQYQNMNFFGKNCVQIMQAIVDQGRAGIQKSLKHSEWQKFLLVKQFKKRKQSQEKLKKENSFNQSQLETNKSQLQKQESEFILNDLKDDIQQNEDQDISQNEGKKLSTEQKSKISEKIEKKIVYIVKIEKMITKVLNKIINSRSSFFVILHNSVRYMIVMIHCSLFFGCYNEKTSSEKAQKKLQIMEFYEKAYKKLSYYCQKKKTPKFQNPNEESSNIIPATGKESPAQYQQNFFIVTEKQKQICEMVIALYKKYSLMIKRNSSITTQKEQKIKEYTHVEVIQKFLDLSNNYMFRFKSLQNKELQINYILKKQKEHITDLGKKKQIRLKEIKNYILEMLLTNYSWMQVILLYLLAEYQKMQIPKKPKISKKGSINLYLEKIRILVINASELISDKKKEQAYIQKETVLKIFQYCQQLQVMENDPNNILKNQIRTLLKPFKSQKIQAFFCENKYINSKIKIQEIKKNQKLKYQTFYFGYGILSNVKNLVNDIQLKFPQWKQILDIKNYEVDVEQQKINQQKNIVLGNFKKKTKAEQGY